MSEILIPDYISMDIHELLVEGKRLKQRVEAEYLSPERKAEADRLLGHLAFELYCKRQDLERELSGTILE